MYESAVSKTSREDRDLLDLYMYDLDIVFPSKSTTGILAAVFHLLMSVIPFGSHSQRYWNYCDCQGCHAIPDTCIAHMHQSSPGTAELVVSLGLS